MRRPDGIWNLGENASPSAVALIRRDLEPMLAQLFAIHATGSAFLRASYEEVGPVRPASAPSGNFMVLNYGFLASIIALIVAVAWAIQSG